MGLYKFLLQGKILLNPIQQRIELEASDLSIPYDALSARDWGYVYEKYAGQVLETEGYAVKYRGLTLGYFDKGIDLVAENDRQVLFIQCKYRKGILSKTTMDWILYKASHELDRQYQAYRKRISFMLMVNDKETNFSRTPPPDFRLRFTPMEKVTYPILQYFLDHNHTQHKVRLECRELRMDI